MFFPMNSLKTTLLLFGFALFFSAAEAQNPRIGTAVGDLAPELVLQSLDGGRSN